MADTKKLYGLILCTVLAVSFWLASLFFSDVIMHFFMNESVLVRMGREYLKYVGISYLFSAISQVCLTLMKNCGAVGASSMISSMTVVLNIVLNAVLIFGLCGFPAMGIKGAALATVTATVVQMISAVIYMKLKMQLPGIQFISGVLPFRLAVCVHLCSSCRYWPYILY